LFFAVEEAETLAKELATIANPPACLTGRISLDTVWTRLPEPAGMVFYISGPPVMLKTLSAQLSERGVPAPQIRIDAWE
jgi:NAD(P)H-flavin reductase